MGATGPPVLAPAEGMGALQAPFLSISIFAFLSFCLLVFLRFCIFFFCIFAFLSFGLFKFLSFCHHYHNHGVNIYYHTNFYLQSDNFSILPHISPQTTTTIATHPPQRFLYLSESQANVLRGLQRFGNNLGRGGAGVLTIQFYNFLLIPDNLFLLILSMGKYFLIH